jgi:adenylate kinase
MDNQKQKISDWLGAGSINIFGLPFAGKDTQAHYLADLLDGVIISGGDILRSYHDQGKIDQLMSSGELIPSDIFMQIVLPYLSREEFQSKPLILSSVGRLQGEESIIFEAANQSGHPIKAVILLNLPEEVVWHHFDKAKDIHDRGERLDDNREALKTRLHEFQTKTTPVIDFYRDKGLLIEVDDSLSREQVAEEIITALYSRAIA